MKRTPAPSNDGLSVNVLRQHPSALDTTIEVDGVKKEIKWASRPERRAKSQRRRVVDGTKGTRPAAKERKAKSRRRGQIAKASRKVNR